MIQFACTKCGQKIVVSDQLGGRRGRCSGCGEVLLITTPPIPKMGEVPETSPPSDPQAESEAPAGDLGQGFVWRYKIRRLDRQTGKEVQPLIVTARNRKAALKKVDGLRFMVLGVTAPSQWWLVGGGVALILLVGSLFWLVRDTWERDNGDRLLARGQRAASLTSEGRNKEAFQEYNAIVEAFQGREPEAPAIRELLRTASEARSKLRTILAEADAARINVPQPDALASPVRQPPPPDESDKLAAEQERIRSFLEQMRKEEEEDRRKTVEREALLPNRVRTYTDFRFTIVDVRVAASPIAVDSAKRMNEILADKGRASVNPSEDDPVLYVSIRIDNLSDRKIIGYRPDRLISGDSKLMISQFKLSDDAGNELDGENPRLSRVGIPVEGRSAFWPNIGPRQSITDVQVFSLPLPKTQHLILKVPADTVAFNSDPAQPEEMVFKFPASSIEGFVRRPPVSP